MIRTLFKPLLVLALASAGTALLACDTEAVIYRDELGCQSNDECPDGVCVGGVCIDGECTKDADCTPLPPTCGDSQTMLLRPIGTCGDDYLCTYEPVEENCPLGCDFPSGICARPPCESVVCNTPPTECFMAIGTCNAGACYYDLRNGASCDDSDPCTDEDSCLEGICAGVPASCNTPPPDACIDNNTLEQYRPLGICQPGQGCQYQTDRVACFFGCVNGACQGDPCGASACDQPPSDYCLDASHARVYQAIGTCNNAVCDYQSADVFCPFGCDTNGCKPDPCAGVLCDTPPAAYCADANTRRTYTPPAACVNGRCPYLAHDTNCQYGCENGTCRGDPCLGTSCDDGNPCTTDSCNSSTGQCSHQAANNGQACTNTRSGKCPQGTCAGGTCLSTANVTCVTEIDVDICHDVEVAGVCTGSGDCVVTQAPPEYYCPDCNGLCIQCYILQLCVPFF